MIKKLLVLCFALTSCVLPHSESVEHWYIGSPTNKGETDSMAVDIIPSTASVVGTMQRNLNFGAWFTDTGATGTPALTIDGNDSTEYKSSVTSESTTKLYKCNLTITFPSSVRVDSIDVIAACGASNSDTGWMYIDINSIRVLSVTKSLGTKTGSLTVNSNLSTITVEAYFQSGYSSAWLSVKEVKAWVSYVDSGLRIRKGSITIALAADPNGMSALRIRTANGVKALALVATSDAMASPLRVRTSSGTKAVAKI